MAKKDMLQYVILGLIQDTDRTGYDMKKLFEGEVGDFWYANHSQVYPELRKMEEAGLIRSYAAKVGEKGEKKYYHMTEEGKALLERWMEEPLGDIMPSRDTFTMKLYLIRSAEDPRLPGLFAEEIARHKEKLSYLKARWACLFGESGVGGRYGHALILDRAIHREEAHLRWLRKHAPGK